MKKLASGFEILRVSDLRFEGMTVEILFAGEQVARLHAENGLERIEIEFFLRGAPDETVVRFQLAHLLEAIETARDALAAYPDPTTGRDDVTGAS